MTKKATPKKPNARGEKRGGAVTPPASTPLWSCPACGRSFTQVNQRHACGTGQKQDVLRNRPESVIRTYEAVEAFAKSLGNVEIVTRERYVLLRTVRIFADLVITADAVRIAIHLARKVDDPLFFKVAEDRKKITHVTKLLSPSDVEAVEPYLKEAFDVSLQSPEALPKLVTSITKR